MEGREEESGLVVDTNILVSALIKDHSKNAEMIKTGYFKAYFPEYGLIELKCSNENTGDMAIVSSIKTKEIKDD
jgi:predicted nucleic acid-binding protein